MEDRYVMLVDENGQPYLAHALNLRQRAFNAARGIVSRGEAVKRANAAVRSAASRAGTGAGRGVRAVHKYIMKIGDGAQARYLYTQDEVKAYMNAAQRQAQAAANKAKREAASRAAQAKRAANQAKETVKNTGKKAVDKVKDKIGVDERQRAVAANKEWANQFAKSNGNSTPEYRQAAERSAKATEEYKNTALGKAETALYKATQPARAVKRKVDKVKDAFTWTDANGNPVSSLKESRESHKNNPNPPKEPKKTGITLTETDKDGNKVTYEGRDALKKTGQMIKNQAAYQLNQKYGDQINKVRNTVDNVKDKVDNVKDAVSDTADKAKSKAEKMREEFRKKTDEASDKVKESADKVKSKADRMRDEFKNRNQAPKAELSPEGTEHILKENVIQENVIKENKIPEQKLKETQAREKQIKEKLIEEDKLGSTSKKAKYGEYDKNDPDFSDESYEKAKNIGDTDFSTFKRSDGTSVILEEDMKWVLPKGVSGNDPEIRKAIKDFADHMQSSRQLGENYTGDQWAEAVTEAINKASEESLKNKNKSSGR